MDFFFSKSIRSIKRCQFKGKNNVECSTDLQCIYIGGKDNLRLRWDKMNGLAGCTQHHGFYTAHPAEFIKTIKKYWPKRYAYIIKHKNEPLKKTYEDIENQLWEEKKRRSELLEYAG